MGALVRCPICGLKVPIDGNLMVLGSGLRLTPHDGLFDGECQGSRRTPGEAMDWLRMVDAKIRKDGAV